MNIQPIALNQPVKKNDTSFKSVYPVVHWVSKGRGTNEYTPVLFRELNETLQKALLDLLNPRKAERTSEINALAKKAQEQLGKIDWAYARSPYVATFNNHNGDWDGYRFEPFQYLTSGDDLLYIKEKYGKPLGRLKRKSKEIGGKSFAELEIAKSSYAIGGLNYVQRRAKDFRNAARIPLTLHTKFETKRNELGEVIGYKFVGLEFLPSEGEGNPLNLGYLKD